MRFFKMQAGREGAGASTLNAVALLTSTILIFMVLFVSWSKHHDNALSERADRANLTAAIEENLGALAERLNNFAEQNAPRGDDSLEKQTRMPASRSPFDYLFLIDPSTGTPIAGNNVVDKIAKFNKFEQALAASLGEARINMRDALRGPVIEETSQVQALKRMSRVTALIGVEDEAYAVAIVPYGNEAVFALEAPRAVVALQRADAEWLRHIGQKAKLPPLEIRDGTEITDTISSIALAHGAGKEPLYLVWHPSRPGDTVFEHLAKLFIGFTSLFAALVVFHSRRVMQELTASESLAKKLAGHDLLSGLPNRLLFGEIIDAEVARCSRTGAQFALFYLDLDRFKEINDSLGHDAGDQMIVAITQRISQALRNGDRIARLGGDEFAVLQTEVAGPHDCELLARRILDAVAEPFNLGGAQVFAGISIGIAMFPHNATDRQELMRLADLGLYRSKNEGRNRFSFFETRMGEELRHRKAIEDELRIAIENDELVLHYQPIMSSDGERMTGVEALVRWSHATNGIVPPDEFISLAEDRGLIGPLGEWVLRKACTDAAAWPDLRIAVNVSPIQFRNKDYVASVARVLKQTSFDPSRLELELTEGVVVADADQAEAAIFDLRAMGVRIALDDFGTGYSSLIYLRRFAFDKIKIDKSFLQSLEPSGEGAIIVHSIVHLGRALGLTVTAEGIETPEQHRFLQALGCHELQGYLFSTPVPACQIDRLLGKDQQRAAQIRAVA